MTKEERKESIKKKLNDYFFDGLLSDIFQAEESISLYKAIGQNAPKIKEGNFGELFSAIQNAFIDRLTLSITKLYEATLSNSARSIPSILLMLEKNAPLFTINGPNTLFSKLKNAGCNTDGWEKLEEPEITRKTVNFYRTIMPGSGKKDPLSKTLHALKDSRDKRVAHNEHIKLKRIAGVNQKECCSLARYSILIRVSNPTLASQSSFYSGAGACDLIGCTA